MSLIILIYELSQLGYRVVARAAPRMTTEDATHGKIEPTEGTVLLYGLDGILRTSGSVTARGRRERRDASPIEVNREQENERQ